MAKQKFVETEISPTCNGCNGSSSQHVQTSALTFDLITQEALSDVFAKEEQTYEEFLNSFTYLKKDVVNHTMTTLSNTPDDDLESQPTAATNHTIGLSQDDVDELIQENLSPGNVIASFLLRKSDSVNPKIQLDNFVDDEWLEMDNSDGYHPTICEESSKEPSTEKTSAAPNNTDTSSSIKGIILPGEIETDYFSRNVPVHLRCLNISTRKSNVEERTKEKEVKCLPTVDQETESTVEEFHLDKDFDYDNVQVTPKFDFLLA